MVIFEIEQLSPDTYRQQTRRSALIVIVTFAVLAMSLAALAVAFFGEPGGDNLRWNMLGVGLGLLFTAALVRKVFWQQPWMAAAVYGWQLKRSLMRITNVMHQVTAGVGDHDPAAMKLLRFYHLALTQMHHLDGNTGSLSEATAEINQHEERMVALNLDINQYRLESEWLDAVKKIDVAPGSAP